MRIKEIILKSSTKQNISIGSIVFQKQDVKKNDKAIADIEKAFAKFKEISNLKKKQVNDGLLSHNGYYEWCIEQRGVIDDIMMKHGLFDRG